MLVQGIILKICFIHIKRVELADTEILTLIVILFSDEFFAIFTFYLLLRIFKQYFGNFPNDIDFFLNPTSAQIGA